jgi:hypothetical protein
MRCRPASPVASRRRASRRPADDPRVLPRKLRPSPPAPMPRPGCAAPLPGEARPATGVARAPTAACAPARASTDAPPLLADAVVPLPSPASSGRSIRVPRSLNQSSETVPGSVISSSQPRITHVAGVTTSTRSRSPPRSRTCTSRKRGRSRAPRRHHCIGLQPRGPGAPRTCDPRSFTRRRGVHARHRAPQPGGPGCRACRCSDPCRPAERRHGPSQRWSSRTPESPGWAMPPGCGA